MTDKYQKDSKQLHLKSTKRFWCEMPESQMFFVVAELNNVTLEFTDVKAVPEG